MLTKGIIFYTDSRLDSKIADLVQGNLSEVAKEKGIPIVSSSLKKMAFETRTYSFPVLEGAK